MEEKVIYLTKDQDGKAVYSMLNASQVQTSGEWQVVPAEPLPVPDTNGKVIVLMGGGFYHKDGKKIN